MRYVPEMIVISEIGLAELEPELSQMTEKMEGLSPAFRLTMEGNGWTHRALALGLMLEVAYESEDEGS